MKPLSVRSKILLTVVVSVIALSLTVSVISTEVLLKSYLSIEQEGMEEDLRRARDAIGEFSNQQLIKLSDWAAWDEAYDYVAIRDQNWYDNTVYVTGLANLDINAMVWSDTQGEVFSLLTVDIDARTEVASSTMALFFAENKELILHDELTDKTEEVVLLPEGPAIVVSLPLRRSEGEDPIPGSLTFVRYLDQAKVAEIADITHLDIQAFPYTATSLPDDVSRARQSLANADTVSTPISADRIVGYTVLRNAEGVPTLLLRVETPRPVYQQGLLSFYIFMGIGAVALLLFGIVILVLLERLVIARFVRLTEDVDKINDVQDLSIRVRGGVKDEIGKLAAQINQMLSWLSSSREEAGRLLEEVKMGKNKAEDMVQVRTKELAEEEARLLASINSLSFGFVIAGVDGTILLKNPSLARILHLSEAPARVRDIAAAFGTDFDLVKFCEDSLGREVPAEKGDVPYGKQFLRVLCAPIFPEAEHKQERGGAIGYVLLIEDITEAKVIQRSREEFFSIASHELRTPLTAIRGNTDLLLDTYKDSLPNPEIRAMLEDINASSSRLIAIVNDFLVISRLEQGRLEIKREPFDLTQVIEGAVRTLSELAHEKGITLSFTPVTIPSVLADPDRTEQVLTNLIGNAIKFTKEGGITVAVEEVGGVVKVSVTDTGIGISEQNQANLFRKFQQASEDMLTRHASQSTGLGLYISKLMMSAMGGEVKLEKSSLGQGSTFSFTLPIA